MSCLEITMDLFNAIMDIINTALNYIFSFLPGDPFLSIIDEIGSVPAMQYINYFVPVDKLLIITSLWLGAIATFYLYQIILRWIKAIDD